MTYIPDGLPANSDTHPAITGFQVADPSNVNHPTFCPINGDGALFVDGKGQPFYWTPDGRLESEPALTGVAILKTVPAPWAAVVAPASDVHPLDTAEDGTAVAITSAGTVTIPKGGTGGEPDPTDPLHTAGLPPKTVLVKTAQGIEINAPLPPELHASLGKRALWAVERSVEAAVAWVQKEWREKVEHKAA